MAFEPEIAIFIGMTTKDLISVLRALALAIIGPAIVIMGIASVCSYIHRQSETATIEVVNCHGGTCDKTTVTFENVGTTNPDTLNHYTQHLLEALK